MNPMLLCPRIFKHCIFIIVAFVAASIYSLYAADPPAVPQPNIAPRPQMKIYVAGQVIRPGKAQLPDGATVLDALAAAGGPAKFADLTKVRIVHKGANIFHKDAKKGEQVIVDLTDMLAGKMPATPLTDGDLLVLPEQRSNH